MNVSPLSNTRASVCLALAVAAALLAGSVPLLGMLLAGNRPGGSQGQLFVTFVYGPYAAMVAAALAVFSIYCGLVRRYLVRRTERRVLVGLLVSLAVLAYLAIELIRILWG
jgi:hypothetical protein